MPVLFIQDNGFDIVIMRDLFDPTSLALMLITEDDVQISPLAHLPIAGLIEFLEVIRAKGKE
jgi:hypothetical protein